VTATEAQALPREGDRDQALLASRPRLRAGVRVGPVLQQGPREVRYVSDRATEGYFRLGLREAFLLERLDGSRSLDEVGADYAEQFGRRLDATHWSRLMQMLWSRHLVDGVDAATLDAARAGNRERRAAAGRGGLLRRWPLPGAADRVEPVARRVGWLLSAPVAVPLTVAGLVAATLGLLAAPELLDAWREAPRRWSIALVSLAVTWMVVAAHELAHGVACCRYGGRPLEIGLMWRFPLLVPYCKVDDVVVMRRRRDRVVTAFAGTYVSLLGILPAAALWWWGPQSGWWHGLAGSWLLFGSVAAVVNLVPLMQLDGHAMVGHALGMVDLGTESRRYVGMLVRRDRAALAAYPPGVGRSLGAYGILSSVLLLAATTGLLVLWFRTLEPWLGPWGAAAFLLAEALVLSAVVGWLLRRRVAVSS
jgi:putative peptide zinc metalloprotease protein